MKTSSVKRPHYGSPQPSEHSTRNHSSSLWSLILTCGKRLRDWCDGCFCPWKYRVVIPQQRRVPQQGSMDTFAGLKIVRDRATDTYYRTTKSEHQMGSERSFTDQEIVCFYQAVRREIFNQETMTIQEEPPRPYGPYEPSRFEVVSSPTLDQRKKVRGFIPLTQENFYVEYTEHNKAIVLQQGIRSCTIGATMMLIIDHYGGLARVPERILHSWSGTLFSKHPSLREKSLLTRSLGNTETMLGVIEAAELKAHIGIFTSLEALDQDLQQRGPAIIAVESGLGGHVVVVDAITPFGVRLRDPFHAWEILVKKRAFRAHGDFIQMLQ